MKSSLIIALDQGTSSCRAVLVSNEGAILGMAQQEFTQYFPESDWVEHDAEEIWSVQMKVLDELISNHVDDITRVVGIGITNQRETTVVWNKHTGQPINRAIVWQDKRTASYCKQLKAEGHEPFIREATGLPIDPYFSGTKLKWILENTSASVDDLCFGTIDTWLIWKMTNGESHVTDYTNASRTLLYNIQKLEWDDKILDLMKIPKSLLPSVQASASVFGQFHYKGHTIPITGVAGDQQAALFGQACFEKGMAKNTYGTGCFMLMNVGKSYVPSEHKLLTTLCCNSSGKLAYALEGSIFVAGAAIQWLRDGINIIEDSADTEENANSVIDSHEVIVVPALAGLGAPYWDMDSRGAIFGLTRAVTRNHLIKGTLDGIAYRTKDVLDAMSKDSGIELDSLKVDGGACKNNYLMQFQSSLLDTKVERPDVTESTAMGVAYLAGITQGLWNAQDILSFRKIDRTFNPQMEEKQRSKLYSQWKKAVSRTLNWKADNAE